GHPLVLRQLSLQFDGCRRCLLQGTLQSFLCIRDMAVHGEHATLKRCNPAQSRYHHEEINGRELMPDTPHSVPNTLTDRQSGVVPLAVCLLVLVLTAAALTTGPRPTGRPPQPTSPDTIAALRLIRANWSVDSAG